MAGLYFDLFLKKYRTNGCAFTIPRKNINRVGRGYFALGLYEKDERAYIGKVLDGKETILELGGCIGVISCITNKKLANPGQHVVVEANPEMIPYLDENKKNNRCSFEIINAVISKTEFVDFFLSDSFVASGIYQQDVNRRKVSVKGVTPRELENKYNLKFNTIVMDIEGGEYDLILENKTFLNDIDKIFMEEHRFILGDVKFKEYEDVLRSLGFEKKVFQENISCWKRNRRHGN